MNAALVEAALSAHGRRLVVIDDGEVDDDLVRDMSDVLRSFCVRLDGRRSARNRTEKAMRCAVHDVGPMAVAPEEHDEAVRKRLRAVAPPFVVAPPSGGRVRTRLEVTDADAGVLMALGTSLGSLAGKDLAERCRQGRLDAKGKALSRRERKRSLTAATSSRWAGAITQTSEDAFGLALRNLTTEARSLRSRTKRIRRRLVIPVGGHHGRVRGYATRDERYEKQRRLQVLSHRLAEVEARLEQGRVSVCRAGKALARAHHHLDEAGMTDGQWQERWRAERLFLIAEGEKDQLWGNLTIRWHPEAHWLEVALPRPLPHLANRPHGRYRLSCPVAFSYRGDEVAAQAATGAVRYDIAFVSTEGRWYLDASWKIPTPEIPTLDQLGEGRVLAVDLNADHLAAMVGDGSGNPVGHPITVPLALAGLPATTRGHLRQAISTLLATVGTNGSQAIVIENLDFAEAREVGRERSGNRPSRGRRGRSVRRLVAGIPTAQFRHLLVQMATNAGTFVIIAVDPAYTSRWGAEHWLGTLKAISADASGHHAAALVIGRRGLRQRARQRRKCDSTPAAHREERATAPVVRSTATGKPVVLPGQRNREAGTREARGQPHLRQKTRTADRASPVDQVAQDRSEPPTRWDFVPLSVEERWIETGPDG